MERRKDGRQAEKNLVNEKRGRKVARRGKFRAHFCIGIEILQTFIEVGVHVHAGRIDYVGICGLHSPK